MPARVLRRSRVERARRSSRVTISNVVGAELVERAAKLAAVGLGS